MKTIFATVATTNFQNRWMNSHKVDFIGFMNSFKKFHPDCEMQVWDETALKKYGLGMLNPKATIGRVLKEQNPDANICIMDCDHIVFARMEEILAADYDIAAPSNYNITLNNVGIKVTSGLHGDGNHKWLIDEHQFLQGGLVASPSLKFWKHYEHAVKLHNNKFLCFENDVFNIVVYTYPYKIKILEHAATAYYGCSILGKEKDSNVAGGKLMNRGLQVKAYHFAHGSAKRKYTEIFPVETHSFIESIINS